MKLPENIKGKNRIRDAAIVVEWKQNHTPTETIAEKFKLTQRRIEQILRTNHAFVKIDKEWEKSKRIHRLSRRLEESEPTKKDELEIMSELRREIEGDGEQVRNETKVIIIRESNADKNQSGEISRSLSVQRI
jgi:hypothetical protein